MKKNQEQVGDMRINSIIKGIIIFWGMAPFLVFSQVAVPIFECVGLYWKPANADSLLDCEIIYRELGSPNWKNALPLWFDDRPKVLGGGSQYEFDKEYRGSIVNLQPGTTYEIELNLSDCITSSSLTATTPPSNK